MREYREREDEELYAYGRPSVSAWVAALAVAFSFFVLGGFIKTYMQLESLREESRREIRDLKSAIDSLQLSAQPVAVRQPQKRVSLLPPAPRSSSRLSDPVPASPPPAREFLAEIDEENPRLTYSIGRSSRREEGGYGALRPHEEEAASCQVVAVNSAQKVLMVEGGRNRGLEPGSRLELSRRGRWIGDLRVTNVFETMSSCEVLHATVNPEPGDVVRTP